MIRPQPLAFIPGITARVAWNAADRLIARIASHFAGGNSSIGATCWMPALLTRMSTPPSIAARAATMPTISSGRLMSAGE